MDGKNFAISGQVRLYELALAVAAITALMHVNFAFNGWASFDPSYNAAMLVPADRVSGSEESLQLPKAAISAGLRLSGPATVGRTCQPR